MSSREQSSYDQLFNQILITNFLSLTSARCMTLLFTFFCLLSQGWKRRWFMLTDHYLYYFKQQEDVKYVGAVQLLFTALRSLTSDEVGGNEPHCFKLVTPQRVFVLQASSAPELQSWTRIIHETTERLWQEEGRLTDEKVQQLMASEVVRRGWLSKRGHNLLKDWRERYFVLKKDYLYYFRDDKVSVCVCVCEQKEKEEEEEEKEERKEQKGQ
jgi:hypothetical protein